MNIAVAKETCPGERRVALVPASIAALTKLDCQVQVETGAGLAAGHSDDAYREKGAQIIDDRRELFAQADVLLQVRTLGANTQTGEQDLELYSDGLVVVGTADPLGNPQAIKQLADRGIMLFALEMIPRISRAQSMDVLSSMATVAGYKAVLLAANHLPKLFPMMMTAAGTITPAKVLIIGAGVAGLQAIASARRLGAVVYAYDVRPVVKEQIESLGAKFVEMPVETSDAEGQGGYAKQMDEEFYTKQREFMAQVLEDCDVCISTAAIPGRPSPLLITADAVRGMKPGSVIVDLAAERGGNCELSQADKTVVEHDVTILGPTNLPSEVPADASKMFAKNVTTFIAQITRDGKFHLDLEDEVVRETLVTYNNEVVNNRLRDLLNLEPLTPPKETDIPLDHFAKGVSG